MEEIYYPYFLKWMKNIHRKKFEPIKFWFLPILVLSSSIALVCIIAYTDTPQPSIFVQDEALLIGNDEEKLLMDLGLAR